MVTNCDITVKDGAVAFVVVHGMLFRQEIVVLLLLTSNTLCFPPGTLRVKFNRQICLRSLPHEPVGGQALGSASLLKWQKCKMFLSMIRTCAGKVLNSRKTGKL